MSVGVAASFLREGVALTGSEGAGRAVAAKAGGLLKKAVIELGGSDAYAVLADADLDLAAEAVVNARVANSGQTLGVALEFERTAGI